MAADGSKCHKGNKSGMKSGMKGWGTLLAQVVVQVARKPLHVGAGDFTYNSPHTWGALGGPAGAASTPSYKEVTVTARVINGRKLYNSLNLFLLPRDLFLKVNR